MKRMILAILAILVVAGIAGCLAPTLSFSPDSSTQSFTKETGAEIGETSDPLSFDIEKVEVEPKINNTSRTKNFSKMPGINGALIDNDTGKVLLAVEGETNYDDPDRLKEVYGLDRPEVEWVNASDLKMSPKDTKHFHRVDVGSGTVEDIREVVGYVYTLEKRVNASNAVRNQTEELKADKELSEAEERDLEKERGGKIVDKRPIKKVP